MACQIGGAAEDYLPPDETTADQIAADQKKLSAALTTALGPPTRSPS